MKRYKTTENIVMVREIPIDRRANACQTAISWKCRFYGVIHCRAVICGYHRRVFLAPCSGAGSKKRPTIVFGWVCREEACRFSAEDFGNGRSNGAEQSLTRGSFLSDDNDVCWAEEYIRHFGRRQLLYFRCDAGCMAFDRIEQERLSCIGQSDKPFGASDAKFTARGGWTTVLGQTVHFSPRRRSRFFYAEELQITRKCALRYGNAFGQ